MRNRPSIVSLLALAFLLPFAACGDDEVTGPGDGMASLSVFLTDAPGYESVWVELTGLTAQGGEGGPVELLGEPTDLVLLTDLVGTVQLLSVNAELDPTTFSQLRLVVGDAVLQDSDGKVYVKGDPVLPPEVGEIEVEDLGELQCPSCSQTGIKVKIPNDEMEIEEGSAALVVDFDVAQSFGHMAGNSGKWVMHPVILGTLVPDANGDGNVLDELGLANSITGTVALGDGVTIPDCPAGTPRSILDFIPTATLDGVLDGEGQPITRAGSVAEGGAFTIGFLAAGPYTMGFVPTLTLGTDQLTFTAIVAPGQVAVSGGEVPGVAFTIQGAVCEVAP